MGFFHSGPEDMEGWIIDAYADYQRDSLVTWLWTHEGVRRIEDPGYRPRFYVHGGRGDLEGMKKRLATLDRVEEVEWASQKIDIRSTEPVPVLNVLPRHYRDLHPLAELVNREGHFHDFRLFDVDLRHSQRYFLQHDILPLSRAAYKGGWERLEEPFALEYELPPLNAQALDVQVDAPEGLPRYEDRLRSARIGETKVEGSEEEILDGLNRALRGEDPDILLTENGDPFVLPYLLQKAETTGVDLVLGREPQHFQHGTGKSYFTYGKIVYKPTQYLLRGRLHLDVNHFAHRESGLHGLAEMSRLARLVPQEMLRLTPGTAITAMQVNEAHWRGYVVLWKKNLPEVFKTAEELVLCDRGGFILEPKVGIHEGIVEVDYASLYPQIMRTYNISPETIFCPCCKEDGMVAPVVGHHTCVRRRGLIPVYLDPVLERKAYYKRKKKETGPNQATYEARDSILKWMLVTCYDGRTLVPYKEEGVAKLASISKIIDPYLPGEPGVVPPSGEMCAYGFDAEGGVVEKPIKKLIKSPAPPEMLRITLDGGRRLVATPNHRFFVQSDAKLVRKRADALEIGDCLPVAKGWKTNGNYPVQRLNAAYVLSRNNDLKDLECWRVRGPGIRKRMHSHFRIVFRHATNAGYTDRSPYIWRDTGVIPLRFLPLLRLPLSEWDALEIAHTRRHGGKLNFLPAEIEIDHDLGFLVGFFMGDGSGTGNMIRLYVGMDESELVGKLLDLLDQKFGLIGVVRKETNARMWVVQFNSSGLTRIFRDVLHVGESANKGKLVIPDWLLNAPRAPKMGFIAGLIASDGAINPGGFALIASATRPFLEGVRFLAGTMDIPSRIHSSRIGGDYPMYGLRLNIEDIDGVWLKDFHRERVAAFPPDGFKRKVGIAPFERVTSIERVPPKSPFVYCFEVGGEPNGFLVEGMIFAQNSFGYMGYSNARYGRIECHEAINAYARELLVRSVHIAEAHGYEVIHGIVDSLWLRPLKGHAPVDEVVQRIQDDVGLPLDLEGTYRWIVFLPCKTTGVGALNRYYGLFEDGEMKLRGIELRRHDTTPFVAQAQTDMLEVFRQARNARQFQDAIPAAIQVLREAAGSLRNGDVPLEDLVISKTVTKPLAEYAVMNYTVAALRQLEARGFTTEPGETVRYVITDRRSRDYRKKVKFAAFLQEDDTPDVWEYLRLLARSGETMLAPFGYTEEGLLQELA